MYSLLSETAMTKTKNGQAILQTTLPKDTVDKMQLPILSINSMSEVNVQCVC